MELLGPVYVISMPPHQMLIQPENLYELCVAVRQAIWETDFDPHKVGSIDLKHGPFAFAFASVARADVKPHWAGTLRYNGQELPLMRWGDEGSLQDLFSVLLDPAYIERLFNGEEKVQAVSAYQTEVTYHE